MRGFENKVAVITGAGSGIGRALAEHYGELGATLCLVDIDDTRLDEVVSAPELAGCTVSTFEVDVSSEEQMADLALQVLGTYDRVDLLINNAGIALGGELKATTLEQFRRLMAINFWGVVYGVQSFSPQMIERGSGHIVNVASINGLTPFIFNGPYNASKAAVLSYTETLRMELAQHGVGVTAVCPGLIKTNITRDRQGGQDDNPAVERLTRLFARRMEKHGAEPRTLAVAIHRAVVRNDGLVLFPFEAVFLRWFYAFFRSHYERVSQRLAQGERVRFPI